MLGGTLCMWNRNIIFHISINVGMYYRHYHTGFCWGYWCGLRVMGFEIIFVLGWAPLIHAFDSSVEDDVRVRTARDTSTNINWSKANFLKIHWFKFCTLTIIHNSYPRIIIQGVNMNNFIRPPWALVYGAVAVLHCIMHRFFTKL